MSKKKKFKKAKKTIPNNVIQPATNNDEQSVTQTDQTATVAASNSLNDELAEKYKHISKDIRFILFLIGLIIVLFIISYFIETKTTLFDTIGDWIYKAANIQA